MREPSRLRRHVAMSVAVIITLVIGVGWFVSSRGSTAASLPWPADGQSTVEVEGMGSLGTKGRQEPVPIASVAKVMTAYVILEGHQLLALMLIPSGNNIARLLARWDAGTEETFVAKMNRAAAVLGMTRTTYTTASGVEPSTRSTAVDQLKLAREVMKDEVFRSIVAMPSVSVPGVPGPLANVNTLLGRFGVIGIKTGSSTPAGGALMWAVNVPVGGTTRLVLGVALHQNADTTPDAGLYAALDSSKKLIIGVERLLTDHSRPVRNTAYVSS